MHNLSFWNEFLDETVALYNLLRAVKIGAWERIIIYNTTDIVTKHSNRLWLQQIIAFVTLLYIIRLFATMSPFCPIW